MGKLAKGCGGQAHTGGRVGGGRRQEEALALSVVWSTRALTSREEGNGVKNTVCTRDFAA